jgi:hypothetical protein
VVSGEADVQAFHVEGPLDGLLVEANSAAVVHMSLFDGHASLANCVHISTGFTGRLVAEAIRRTSGGHAPHAVTDDTNGAVVETDAIYAVSGANGGWTPASRYCLQADAASYTPNPNATYYFGALFNLSPATASGNRRIYIPRAGTVKAVYVFFNNTGTLDSSAHNSDL